MESSWDVLNGGAISYDAARIFLVNRAFEAEDGTVPARTVGLVIGRMINGGMHEDLDVTNHGAKLVRFNLEMAIRCDFADVFEVRANHIVRRGRITTAWSEAKQRLNATYRNADFVRAISVGPLDGSPKAGYANGRLSFEVKLAGGETWHCCLLYETTDCGRGFAAPLHCILSAPTSHASQLRADWRQAVLKIRTSNEEFYRLFHQAIDDMAALRLPYAGIDHKMSVPAAGLPWFLALFGRDSLVASLQTMLVYPDFARGTLDVLGSLQARERDDYRDAEPGKILHEMRHGELAHFNLVPHTPLLRNGGRDAALSHHLARGLACHGRPKSAGAPSGHGGKPAWPGSTRLATAMAMAFRNMRRALQSATKTCRGRIPAMPSRTRMARWSRVPGLSVNCRITCMMPGCGWPKSTRRSAAQTAPRACATRPRPYSAASMGFLG